MFDAIIDSNPPDDELIVIEDDDEVVDESYPILLKARRPGCAEGVYGY